MYKQVEKPKENKSRVVANSVTQKKSKVKQEFGFVDNRPEAIAQRKLQEIANNSPQVMQLRRLQNMADNSPQAKQAAQLQVMADNYAAQQHQPIQKKENNTGLPDNLKTGIENMSGYSMDDVKVHRNSAKPSQLQAHAYTQGTDIHLGSGQEKHLPHEAWHVVQQKQGRVKPTMQMKDKVNINDDTGLEKEADVMGSKAVNAKQNLNENVCTSFKSAHPVGKVTQAKFGFEIELKILATTEKEAIDGITYMMDPIAEPYPVLGRGNGFAVHVDHSGSGGLKPEDNRDFDGMTEPKVWIKDGKPIVELVTTPMDEFQMSEDDVANVMKRMANFATDASTKTNGFKSRRRLNEISKIDSVANNNTYIASERVGFVKALEGGIQMTQGVRLDRIDKYFAKKYAVSTKYKARTSMGEAQKVAGSLIDWIVKKYSDPAKLADLKGLLTLVAYYLLVGDDGDYNKWMKNFGGGMFYKNNLAQVRDALDDTNKEVVDNEYKEISDKMISLTKRTSDQPVVYRERGESESETLVGEWVERVLKGENDMLFDELKNVYANAIPPDHIGPEDSKHLAAVIENREKIARLVGGGGTTPDHWEDLGKFTYRFVREINED